jgi:hypothetical protein
MAKTVSGQQLTSEEHNQRMKIRMALAIAHRRMKDECGIAHTATVNSARKRLQELMGKIDAEELLCDIATRDFFYVRQLTPGLAQVLIDNRIHMLSLFLKLPLEEAKELIEKIGCEFSLALEWTYKAFHEDQPAPNRNTWMGVISEARVSN